MNRSDPAAPATDLDCGISPAREKNHHLFNVVVLSLVTLALLFSTSTTLLARASGLLTGRDKPLHLQQAGKTPHITTASAGLAPQDLWKLYNLPGLKGGAGQTIAEVIDGDIPSLASDLRGYSLRFGLPQCAVATGCLTIKYQGGARMAPGTDPAEGILDVELMHAIAPQAKILVYFMHVNNASIARGPSEIMQTPGLRSINMSYGFAGNGKAYEALYANNPNHVALFAASGDSGFADIGPPSIYPEVIAVGGTVVHGATETAWFGSGGGFSTLYPEPAYQKTYGIPQANNHRGNPDVAAVAGSPVAIYELGKWVGEEGTSVAAPIWTGIAALVNKPITNTLLYSLAKSKPDSFHDITSGTNGKCGYYCTARPGYDYITGLGTPRNFVANFNAMK